MEQLRKWKYTPHRLNPFRLEDGEITYQDDWQNSPHRMTWRTRKDALTPRGGPVAYQAKCKCGWQDITLEQGEVMWLPKRLIHKRYARHIEDVWRREGLAKQGRFDDV
jgi:hypothetical protein